MRTKTLRWFAGLVVALGAVAGSFVSCSQPQAECQTGLYSPYAATFTLTSAAPACMKEADKGDLVGAEFFHPATADGKTYDDSQTTIAIHSQTMGKWQRVYADDTYADGETLPFTDGQSGHAANAMGKFRSNNPDGNDFCYVDTTQPELEDFTYEDGGAVDDAGAPANPELKFEDQWSNLKFYVTAAAPGNQFSGDLTRTVNGCAVQYHVVGMWPAVNCTKLDPTTGAPVMDANGNTEPDITLCSPCANPDAGMATGSGINPNFPVACTQIFNADDTFGRGAAPFYCTLMGGDPPQVGAPEPACALFQGN